MKKTGVLLLALLTLFIFACSEMTIQLILILWLQTGSIYS